MMNQPTDDASLRMAKRQGQADLTQRRGSKFRKAALVAIMAILASCGKSTDEPKMPVTPTESKSESVIDVLRKKAESGDPKAQFQYAKHLVDGDGIEKNGPEAFKWFLKAAEAGNSDAALQVSSAFKSGIDVDKSEQRASEWLAKALASGNPAAQLEKAEEFGMVVVTNTLIWSHRGGTDESNAAQYIEWLTKAANQNHAEAKYKLGVAHVFGIKDVLGKKTLFPSNLERGVQLWRESADADYWKAQWALGVIYQAGYASISPNESESDKYWAKLLAQSNTDTMILIAMNYAWNDKKTYQSGKNKYRGKSLDFDESNAVAFDWYRRVSEKSDKNLPFALYKMGTFYAEGIGVLKDVEKAMSLYKQAADKGMLGAMDKLALAYYEGTGVVKDYSESFRWFSKVANARNSTTEANTPRARNALGVFYEFGWGVEQSPVLAYAWYNLAAAAGFSKSKENLARVEKALTNDDIKEAQSLSREWKPGTPLIRATQTAAQGDKQNAKNDKTGDTLSMIGSGTGFAISENGYVLTNNHVVQNCLEVRVPAESKTAKLIVADKTNDLALLKIDSTFKNPAILGSSDDLKQGEEVVAFGFPLDGYLPASGNITQGIVSALAGPGNNSSVIQVTAPIQPGNSGGAVMNMKGKVVGVVVGKADAIKIAKAVGDIPQNINFAISAGTARSFLDGNQIAYGKGSSWLSFSRSTTKLADSARGFSLKLECWKK